MTLAITHQHPVVALTHVSRSFGQLKALDDVSLRVNRGEVVGLIGRSGAGKSTLIRCLNGLEKPDHGAVEIDGRDIVALSERELRPLRQRIGMIFQHFNLLSARSVIDNVALPLKIIGVPKAKRLAKAAELLDLVGIADKAQAWPAQLSGGQKQRVGIARALAGNPDLLLSDEATSALDPETTGQILELLATINRDLGLTILLITHEMDVVRAIADRLVVLEAGRIVEDGSIADVFARPASQVTQALLAGTGPQLPAHFAKALTDTPSEPVVFRIDLVGEQARQPVVTEAAQTLGLPLVTLHGGIDHIRTTPVARYFVQSATTDRKSLAQLSSWFAQRSISFEVLGHVSRSH